ncbi:DUF1697 domain-containing protein [Paenibacillus sp. Marseille-P2973]|uniref:DUF1697 domain-containing protein n=1 Tax=Paenibacillus sp. Marseille-P2973 TaxID=1871032 RepID=UPI001B365E86|nr:DUF1697 domain-containing protein [Paenibacillus sp. Marseille-P2973]MBQ4899778.1 DUF1697 domain-containing protein [Paenibacillus sp. Marseille-P2973]
MRIYVALLRGINVGGKNKIKMADLRAELEKIGLTRVQTYIQSGNVLFESEKDEPSLRQDLERMIEAVFGIKLTVMLRTAEEVKGIVEQCPFPEELVAEAAATRVGESLHVAMLTEPPAPAGVDKLEAVERGTDLYIIAGRDVYLLFRDSIRDSKLAANLHKLGVEATVRNWKTMNKLVELAEGMKRA